MKKIILIGLFLVAFFFSEAQRTYYLTTAASDLGSGDNFSNQIITTIPGNSNMLFGVNASSTENDYGFSISSEPALTQFTNGTITVTVVLSLGDSNLALGIRLHRVNATGTIQESTAVSSPQLATAGTKIFTFSSVTWTSGSSTDRFEVEFQWENISDNTVFTQVEIGASGTKVETPFTDYVRRIFVD